MVYETGSCKQNRKIAFPTVGWAGGGRRAMCCTMTSSRCRARPTHTRVPCAKGSTQVISAVHTHTITHHSVSPLSLRIERARLRLRLPLQLPHHPCPGLALHRCIRPQRVCHSLSVVSLSLSLSLSLSVRALVFNCQPGTYSRTSVSQDVPPHDLVHSAQVLDSILVNHGCT